MITSILAGICVPMMTREIEVTAPPPRITVHPGTLKPSVFASRRLGYLKAHAVCFQREQAQATLTFNDYEGRTRKPLCLLELR